MDEVTKIHTKMRVSFVLMHFGGPKGLEQSQPLHDLPGGSPVLIYRTNTKRWKGPRTFISVEGETAVVQIKRGRRIFRTTCVKPPVISHLPNAAIGNDEESSGRGQGTHNEGQLSGDDSECLALEDDRTGDNTKADGGKTFPIGRKRKGRKDKTYTSGEFNNRRKDKLEVLLRKGTFKDMRMREVPEGIRVLDSRFIDEIKGAGERILNKSRLIAQNYGDEDTTRFTTEAPTLRRFSKRNLLCLAASLPVSLVISR